MGLEVTIEANLKIINFLDICMDLDAEIYKPYTKPNTTPLYINTQSNHPPTIIKNLPDSINKRLSSISCNKDEFDKAAPLYQDALEKSGYKYKLSFNPEEGNPRNISRNRKRIITWFNPPFSQSVKNNVGKLFLELIDRSFPPGHPLRKICNRNTIKLSYRCTPNMGSVISARNSKLLEPHQPANVNGCNCRDKQACPAQGNCQAKSVIYRTTLTEQCGRINTYTGLTCNEFKDRWHAHKYSFNHIEAKQTTLSNYIHQLKEKQVKFDIHWDIIDTAKPFNPVTGTCALCNLEAYYINFKRPWATLNKRSEIYASCRHKRRMLLTETKDDLPKP